MNVVDASGGSQTPEERKLHLIAGEIGLSREDRIDLAQYLLRRSITSWKQLDHEQVMRLLDAIEGHQLVSELLRQRHSP